MLSRRAGARTRLTHRPRAPFDTDDAPFRLGLLAAMLAAIAVAAGLDGSLSEERPADTFVIGYALLLAVLVALFVRAHRRFPQARALTGRYEVGAALWLASLGFAPAVRP